MDELLKVHCCFALGSGKVGFNPYCDGLAIRSIWALVIIKIILANT